MFELHLLESGISGIHRVNHLSLVLSFELHLLESGISGSILNLDIITMQSLNSTYWNLVFQAAMADAEAAGDTTFELHLLESGISGSPLPHSDCYSNCV
mgnify:FL=1